MIASPVYDSFLGKLKLVTSTLDGFHIIIRPFSEDTSIIREVFERKVYEAYVRPHPNDVVIDVGAHLGSFTIRAAKMVRPKGLVVALEPYPENYELLKTNVRLLHTPSNIISVRTALGDREGFADLFLNGGYMGHSSIITRKTKSIKVPITTLDRLVTELGIEHVDFVKIDVEGAEYDVLKGAENTLKSNDIRLSMETHGKAVRRKVIDLLERLRYDIIELETGKETYEESTSMLYAWKRNYERPIVDS